jgi:formylglycine-generating enzyme required for sulfatase activity
MSKSDLMRQLEACGLTFCHIPAGEYEVGADPEIKSLILIANYYNERGLPSVTTKQKVKTSGFYISKQLLRLSHWRQLCEKDKDFQTLLPPEQLGRIEASAITEDQTWIYPTASDRQIHENTEPRPDPLKPRATSQQLDLDPAITVDKALVSQIATALGADLPRWYEWEIATRGKEGFLYPWGDEYFPKSLSLESQDYSMDEESVMGFYKYDQEVFFIHDFKDYATRESPFGLVDLARMGREWNQTYESLPIPDDEFILRSLSDLGTMAEMVPGIRYNSWRNNFWDYKRAFSMPALPCYARSTVGENPEIGYGKILYPEAAFRLMFR